MNGFDFWRPVLYLRPWARMSGLARCFPHSRTTLLANLGVKTYPCIALGTWIAVKSFAPLGLLAVVWLVTHYDLVN